jgi:hypothetical protein
MSDFYPLAWLPLLCRIIQVLQVLKLDGKTLRPVQIDWVRTEDFQDLLDDLFRFGCRRFVQEVLSVIVDCFASRASD